VFIKVGKYKVLLTTKTQLRYRGHEGTKKKDTETQRDTMPLARHTKGTQRFLVKQIRSKII
jgi:hypothetical protein